jgi:hypothetical protein
VAAAAVAAAAVAKAPPNREANCVASSHSCM